MGKSKTKERWLNYLAELIVGTIHVLIVIFGVIFITFFLLLVCSVLLIPVLIVQGDNPIIIIPEFWKEILGKIWHDIKTFS